MNKIRFNFFIVFTGLCLFNCTSRKSTVDNFQKNQKDIINLNKSFTGKWRENDIILNINHTTSDSVFAQLYAFKEIDPYQKLINFRGIMRNNEIYLKNSDSIYLNGKIEKGVYKGEIVVNNYSDQLSLIKTDTYSNGNLKIKSATKYKNISLGGFKDTDVCQGELFQLGSFIKNSNYYKLLYFSYPSTGLYKGKGNCGSGQESLIALVKIDDKIDESDIEIINLVSCHNAQEVLINGNNLTAKNLINDWNQQKKIEFKIVNLKRDSYKTVVIDPINKNSIQIGSEHYQN